MAEPGFQNRGVTKKDKGYSILKILQRKRTITFDFPIVFDFFDLGL